MSNANLQAARAAKNDEFFTRYEDIAAEVEHHREAFRGACVYCNCDDPKRSNFWAFFHRNYKDLGLCGLYATGYTEKGLGCWAVYAGGDDEDLQSGMFGDFMSGAFDYEATKQFLSGDCIVVTNPPFSRFREYVQFLHRHGKRFLIIAPAHALKAKGVLDIMAAGAFVCGQTRPSIFETPDGGTRRMGNTVWLNGLQDGIFPEPLRLEKRYSPEDYSLFDNYAALSVDRLDEIPVDYPGVVGAPVTVLQAFRPDSMEIIGADESSGAGASNGLYTGGAPDKHAYVHGKRKFTRVFVRLKRPATVDY